MNNTHRATLADPKNLAEIIVQAERDFVGVPTLELLAVHQAMARAVVEYLRETGELD